MFRVLVQKKSAGPWQCKDFASLPAAMHRYLERLRSSKRRGGVVLLDLAASTTLRHEVRTWAAIKDADRVARGLEPCFVRGLRPSRR